MGRPDEKTRHATYAEYAAVPAHKVAEIINGVLHVFPRPALPHAFTSSQLGEELGPFRLSGGRRGGPGGWWILDEPEVHLLHEEPVIPDLAGWRLERVPQLPETAYFTLPPDWICEVLSKSTEKIDREEKMPLYAAHGVRHAWLVDPIAKTLEVHTLDEDRRWSAPVLLGGTDRARIPPFDAIELDLSFWWAKA